ncbi:hypothetical protein SELMODRAFT_421855 [Selaginella moellendorffii]|uniref:PHD-type domain-containing protein n=1 Tax=Selaginella moellendorffii TaxID=88036 RepID=D8SGK3_SELML|nr:hypothetical protein SELMODRAFT_421855 [Selaginella moellendorffii]
MLQKHVETQSETATGLAFDLKVDDKHCSKCKSREDPSRGKYRGKWIVCDVCQQCYNFSCTRVTKKQELEVFWQCSSCKSMKREEHLEPRRLLRYYEGDLKAALLEAGADAIQYVWRPLIKNDGAVGYTILPRTLAQPTIAPRHPVSAEALKTHISALRAWNDIYGGTSKPDEFVLCFFLAESNYDGFRATATSPTKQAVKGIRQCKVLLRYDGEVCKPNYFDPVEDVLGECEQEGEVCFLNPSWKVFVSVLSQTLMPKQKSIGCYCSR